MSSYRSRDDHNHRPYPSRPREDFYDDRRSHSRSPDRPSDSPYRRSPPHDIPRGPSHRHGRDHYRDGYTGIQGHHRSRSHDRRDYYDRRQSPSPKRDRRGHYDRRGRDRNRSRSRSRASYGDRSSSRGRPSKEIMLEGLAPHLNENDISSELQQNYHVARLDDVRIIRDHKTKQSRQFGFLRFPTQEEAESFMDANYPFIYLYGRGDAAKHTDDAKVRIAYGKERKDPRVEEADWTCKICNINNFSTRARCFRCQSLRPEQPSEQKAANVGDNDAASDNTPSQFLLLRGLESSVSEDLLAKGVAKLNKPAGTPGHPLQSSSKKGAKVASTTGDANLGAKEGTLRRVLLVRDRKTNESWRYGFAEYATSDDAQAALTRFNSFERFTIASKQVLVSYIHAGVFIPALPNPANDQFTFSPLANPAMKLAYWDENAYVTELVLSLPDPVAEATDTVKPQAETDALKVAKEADKGKKRKAQEPSTSSAKKPAPSHLQFWSNRHAELHGIKKSGNEDGANNDSTMKTSPTRSYADLLRNCCYLCMRQFKSSAEVNKHERVSDLHRSNLRDEAKVRRAEHKLEKHGISQKQQNPTEVGSGIEYRDRARERRKIYGVVNKKGEQVGAPATKAKTSSEPDEESQQPQVQSKGAALLSKMGYTAGSGLGASGEGMTAPISQDVYVAGVGLGAQGGKVGDAVTEAERNTRGDYSAFAERTREGARERYARLGD